MPKITTTAHTSTFTFMVNSQPMPPFDNPKRRAYERRKKFLLTSLGGKCSRCDETLELQFDCIEPQGPLHHGLSVYDRMIFYTLQHRAGNLQLLCPPCHHIKSAQDKFNRREAAIAENMASSSFSSPDTSNITACSTPLKKSQPQQPAESDWQFQCRRAREINGIE